MSIMGKHHATLTQFVQNIELFTRFFFGQVHSMFPLYRACNIWDKPDNKHKTLGTSVGLINVIEFF